MTANWDKLNEEFSNLMDTFTDSDWEKWENNRAARKALRRMELLLKAKIQMEKLKLASLIGSESFGQQDVMSSFKTVLPAPVISCSDLTPGNNYDYALAA
jgi:hypothetical protein